MKCWFFMREENRNTRRKKLLEKQRDWELTHSMHMPRRVWQLTQNALVEDTKVSSPSPLDESMQWTQYEKTKYFWVPFYGQILVAEIQQKEKCWC